MTTATLLIELFTEELPPKALGKLGQSFANAIHEGLTARGLADAGAARTVYATPRRLAVSIAAVRDRAPDRAQEKKLMPAKVAFDAGGAPTPALLKRLEKEGAGLDAVTRKTEGSEEVVYCAQTIKGVDLAAGAQAALDAALAALPIPKTMRYQLADGLASVSFVRPAHGLVAMHGAAVLPVSVLGLHAGNVVHGHRFQGAKDIELAHADEYESKLEQAGGVIASFEKRRAEIHRLLRERAEECGDTLGPEEDYAALLDEVTALVEMPTVYVGRFESEFLVVPPECLILTMKLNQKYFPLFLSGDETAGGLSSRFLIVSNMRLDDPRNVIEGNQRVVRPRLADAKFFFEQDKKVKLADRLPKLAAVVYHNKLGSQGERVERVRAIATSIAGLLGLDAAKTALIDLAAQLAKADLVTDMVGEFPELQGTMGKHYARAEGIGADVADAIEDHYKPRFAGDALPRNDVGVIVALADKLETLVGLFGIGQAPTGDKDPFALRRHALGIVRMLVERRLAVDLTAVLNAAASAFGARIADPVDAVRGFLFDRFAVSLREQGYTAQEVDAVLSLMPERLSAVALRLAAVRAFAGLPESASLAAANKRIGNILRKSEHAPSTFDRGRFADSAETVLADAIDRVSPVANAHFEAGRYTESLSEFAKLREPVDRFFDEVMVNADDPAIRANRLGLLATLHREMNRVADLARLAS